MILSFLIVWLLSDYSENIKMYQKKRNTGADIKKLLSDKNKQISFDISFQKFLCGVLANTKYVQQYLYFH